MFWSSDRPTRARTRPLRRRLKPCCHQPHLVRTQEKSAIRFSWRKGNRFRIFHLFYFYFFRFQLVPKLNVIPPWSREGEVVGILDWSSQWRSPESKLHQ